MALNSFGNQPSPDLKVQKLPSVDGHQEVVNWPHLEEMLAPQIAGLFQLIQILDAFRVLMVTRKLQTGVTSDKCLQQIA